MASSIACSFVVMKVDVPHFMSITKQSISSENFLDKIDDVIKEISLTVSVTSLRE